MSTGRPKRSDVPTLLILRNCAERSISYRRPLTLAPPADGPPLLDAIPGYPLKVLMAKADQLVNQGIIDYGVSLRTAFPTEAGWQILVAAEPENADYRAALTRRRRHVRCQ